MPKTTVAYLFMAGFLAACLSCPGVEVRAEDQVASEPPPPTIEELMAKLSSRDDAELYRTIQDLGLRGPKAAPAVADLIKILKDEKKAIHIRVEAALVLGEIGPLKLCRRLAPSIGVVGRFNSLRALPSLAGSTFMTGMLTRHGLRTSRNSLPT